MIAQSPEKQWNNEWQLQANEWMRIAYSAKMSQLLPKYQYQ